MPGQQPEHVTVPCNCTSSCIALQHLGRLSRTFVETGQRGKLLFAWAFMSILLISQSWGNREQDPDKLWVSRDGCEDTQVKHLHTQHICPLVQPHGAVTWAFVSVCSHFTCWKLPLLQGLCWVISISQQLPGTRPEEGRRSAWNKPKTGEVFLFFLKKKKNPC